jgi:hypothetical protein
MNKLGRLRLCAFLSVVIALVSASSASACPFQGPGMPFCIPLPGTAPPCPCANFGALGHGCDNSVHTGGAMLAGTGTTTPDTIHLTQSFELPSALSVFLQGDLPLSIGVVFGDGIRCTGGHLLRLYTHPAAGGTVMAPAIGDPPITVRSATLGMPIPVGSTRYYQVYYRDPGFICPPASEAHFNVGNGWVITWV